MAFRVPRIGLMLAAIAAMPQAATAQTAYLFWLKPDFSGTPVKGDEPGIGVAMPGAKPNEISANLIWNLRAGLNVAALQCQFAPMLNTVRNYNQILKHHSREFQDSYAALTAYFKRTKPKGWQTALDQYTTRTYNGFSTMHAQLGFCETAGQIGRDALGRKKGELHLTAETRMREFRNSLIPVGDARLAYGSVLGERRLLPLDAQCWDRKGYFNTKKCRA